MDSRERVIRALESEEPDRVPITEIDLEVPVMEKINGEIFPVATSLQTQVVADRKLEEKKNKFKIECYKRVGFDLLVVDLSAPETWKPSIKPDGTMIDLWGRTLRLDKQAKAWVPYGTIFSTPEDLDDFEFPDPEAPGWMFSTEYSRSLVKDSLGLATFIRDPFAHAWEMLTPMKFVPWMYRERKFIDSLMKKLTEFNIEIITRISEMGADFIISGGDYCEEMGPMAPTRFFKESIFPNLRKQVEAAHKNHLKLIKHTDGNLNPILDDLANIVDGIHSLDPTARMDIGDVKLKYGNKLLLIGNVSVDSLAKKSRIEVVEETKECIKQASPGGGHILSSSNSWAGGAKLENCLAMVETGKRYGTYPLMHMR